MVVIPRVARRKHPPIKVVIISSPLFIYPPFHMYVHDIRKPRDFQALRNVLNLIQAHKTQGILYPFVMSLFY